MDQAGGGVARLIAFGLYDRVYNGRMGKVPKHRWQPPKDPDADPNEGRYTTSYAFAITVKPADLLLSRHLSHAFKPAPPDVIELGSEDFKILPEVEEEAREIEEAAGQLRSEIAPYWVAASGIGTTIKELALGFTLGLRDRQTGETIDLRAEDGLWLDAIYPDEDKATLDPEAVLLLIAKGCQYELAGRGWPFTDYDVQIFERTDQPAPGIAPDAQTFTLKRTEGKPAEEGEEEEGPLVDDDDDGGSIFEEDNDDEEEE